MFISCGSDQFRIDTNRISGQIKLLYRYTVTAGLLLSIAMNHIKRVVCLISELALPPLSFLRSYQAAPAEWSSSSTIVYERSFTFCVFLLPHGTAAEQA